MNRNFGFTAARGRSGKPMRSISRFRSVHRKSCAAAVRSSDTRRRRIRHFSSAMIDASSGSAPRTAAAVSPKRTTRSASPSTRPSKLSNVTPRKSSYIMDHSELWLATPLCSFILAGQERVFGINVGPREDRLRWVDVSPRRHGKQDERITRQKAVAGTRRPTLQHLLYLSQKYTLGLASLLFLSY